MTYLNEKARLTVQHGWLQVANDIMVQVMDAANSSGQPRETIEQARSAVLRALEANETELCAIHMKELGRH